MTLLTILWIVLAAAFIAFFIAAVNMNARKNEEIEKLREGDSELEESYQMQILTLEETVDSLRAAILGQEQAHNDAIEELKAEWSLKIQEADSEMLKARADARRFHEIADERLVSLGEKETENLNLVQENSMLRNRMLPDIGGRIENTTV